MSQARGQSRAFPERVAAAFPPAEGARDEIGLYAGAFSIVAGLIHIQAAVIHFDHIWWYGVLFSLLAGFQLAWALAVRRQPSRCLLDAGIVINLGAIGVWVLSRTVGMPIGPEAGEPEPVGLLDLGAVLAEAALVALALALARDALERLLTSSARLAVYAALTLSGLTLFLGGGHSH